MVDTTTIQTMFEQLEKTEEIQKMLNVQTIETMIKEIQKWFEIEMHPYLLIYDSLCNKLYNHKTYLIDKHVNNLSSFATSIVLDDAVLDGTFVLRYQSYGKDAINLEIILKQKGMTQIITFYWDDAKKTKNNPTGFTLFGLDLEQLKTKPLVYVILLKQVFNWLIIYKEALQTECLHKVQQELIAYGELVGQSMEQYFE